MEFAYEPSEDQDGKIVYRPRLPITFTYKNNKLKIGRALVDTGSDFTILPLDVAHDLEIELDDSKILSMDAAGGGVFEALPSQKPVGYTIETDKFRPIRWEGIIYFAENEPVTLLGHYQCLEKFDLTFYGPERKLSILPRFKFL